MPKAKPSAKLNPKRAERFTVMVVDLSWYMHRAFHVLKFRRKFIRLDRTMAFMLLSMIVKDALDVRATHIVICQDAPKSFRYSIYPRYKEGRREITLEHILGAQTVSELGAEISVSALQSSVYSYLKAVKDVLKAAGLKVVCIKGMESDDVMGACAVSLASEDVHVVISTRDKDLMSVVGPHVSLYRPGSKKIPPVWVDREHVFKEKGVYPEQMRDFLCLTGDSVDGIPGIPGVKTKTAAKMLAKHKTIRRGLKAKNCKYADKMREYLDKLLLARSLVNLRTDCWKPTLQDAALGPMNDTHLLRMLGTVPDGLIRLHSSASAVTSKGLFV